MKRETTQIVQISPSPPSQIEEPDVESTIYKPLYPFPRFGFPIRHFPPPIRPPIRRY